MKKILTKIVGVILGFGIALGIGSAIVMNNNSYKMVSADSSVDIAYDITWDSNGTQSNGSEMNGSVSPFTIKLSKGYKNTSYTHDYANGTITISGNQSVSSISSVVITASGNYSGLQSSGTFTISGGGTGASASGTATVATLTAGTGSTSSWGITHNKQIRFTNIAVTYSAAGGGDPAVYTVTYAAGGATSGTVPTDSNEYESGDEVTVLDNTGNLEKTNYVFDGWTDGTDTYNPGDHFDIDSSKTLTAVWDYYRHYSDNTSLSTITWDLANPEYVSASESQMTWNSPKATMVANKASAGTNTNNFCPPSQSSTRFYKNSTLTISPADGYQINSIVFSATTTNYATELKNSSWSNASSAVSESTVTITPTDRRSSVTATIGNTTGHTQVVVNYSVITLDPTVELSDDSVSLKTNQESGVTVSVTTDNIDSPSYLWSTEDSNITLENATTSTVTIKPDTDESGSATVTLTVNGTNGGLPITPIVSSVSVTLSVPGPGESAGTAYTVADAIAHIASVVDGGTATGDDGNYYYATGIVCRLFSNSVNANGQISYYISDDGTTSGDQLEAYNGKGLNGASFSNISDIEVGDTVVIYGRLKVYNTTYEFDANNYLVSQTKAPKVTSISLTPSAITIEPEATGDVADLFSNIVINQEVGSTKTVNDIVWTSDDDDIFLIDDGAYLAGTTHRSSTTIHATIGGVEYGNATINIIDPNVPVIPFDNPVEWVLVDDISSLTVGDQVILVGTKSEVTYAATTYSSGNNVPADTENTLTVSGNKVTGVVDTMIYTLEAGSEDNSVAFKDSNDNYLYAASSSANNMKAKDEVDANASFILNADGTVVAQGSNTRNYMRYNNDGGSNLFACYSSSSDAGDLVTFYKRIGGSGVVDLTSASSTATLHGEELEPGVASNVSIKFGAKISIAQWDAIEDVADVTDYGVLLFRTRKALSSDKPVQDAIDLGKTPTKISKGSGDVPSDPEGGYYSFTITVNISSPSNYDIMFCAAPFIEVDGTIYILDEVQYSVKSLAEYYIDHDIPSELSDDALIALAL